MTHLVCLVFYAILNFKLVQHVSTTSKLDKAHECSWSWKKSDPIIYYVNMDKSTSRRKEMEKQFTNMGIKFERFRGLTLSNIHIPEDLQSTWNTKQARYETEELDYSDLLWGKSRQYKPNYGTNFHLSLSDKELKEVGQNGDREGDGDDHRLQIVVTGLYGRRRVNRLAELGCTISHLMAMRRAIYSDLLPNGTHSQSRYAIITEDDVVFPFDVDWDALVRSAPHSFGILQLFNSNEETMQSTYNNYMSSVFRASNSKSPNRHLWHERFPKQPGST
jgi:hypothetical protein